MDVVTQKITHDICTGCGGCVNICPVDAIEMNELTDGFLCPEIDENKCIKCGKCLETCPVYHYENKNDAQPEVYAGFATKEIQEKSSSGGIFSLLAMEIFKNEGHVAGAVFGNQMYVKHIIADSMDACEPMRGAKYLQSDVGMVYRHTKKYLDQGEYVLFSGCPCQVAALQNYLGADYPNLLCVDILCHGVPSYKTFHKYLDEIRGNKQVLNVLFRDKQFGWDCTHIKVLFSDGTTYIGDLESDNYVKGFFNNLFLRSSCETCVFSEFPRTGDISIGDFWGIEEVDESLFNDLGTSIIFINTENGTFWFQRIKDQLSRVERLPFEPERYPNRISAQYYHNPKRAIYFADTMTKSFNENVNYLLPKEGSATHRYLDENIASKQYSLSQHDVGLVCNYYARNFGGALTQYALYNVLKDMGYSVYMIEHPKDANDTTSRETLPIIYSEVPYPEHDMAPEFENKFEMRVLNDFCDKFVVGSDQLFQYDLYNDMGKIVTLDWVNDNKCKIAYAASFGHDHIWGEKKVLGEMAHFMQLFDGFSAREDVGVEICKEWFGVEAEWVLDPIFLCNKKIISDLANKVIILNDKPYVGSYMLDPSTEKKHMIEKLMTDYDLGCDIFSEIKCNTFYMRPFEELPWHDYSIEERINVIGNSKIFITDSYHATCLCIIMKKPFISVLNEKRGASRFESLLERLGLKHRLIHNLADLEQMENTMKIDFDPVYKILEEDIINSKNWLKNKLQTQKNMATDSYGILCDKIYERDIKIQHLEDIIERLSQELGYELDKVIDFFSYLNILKRNQYKYVVLVAIKDTPGYLFDEKLSTAFRALGFVTDMQSKHWRSYVGVLDGDNVVFENLSELDKSVEEEMNLHGLNVRIVSKCLNAGNEACICINEKNYAVNLRGFNLVIWDKEIEAVIDKVCFDTHAEGIPCYRS